MSRHSSCLLNCSAPQLLYLAGTKRNQALALALTLFLVTSGFSQQTSPAPDSPDNTQTATANAYTPVAVPAGTNIALVLTHPIQTRLIHRGDDIYAQTTAPVISGNQVVIPPGTFVQGKVDKIERKSSRGEIHLQSMSLVFPDGYTAPVAGPITFVSDEGYALKDPGKGRAVGAFALPAAGLGLGALIGHAAASSQPNTITSTLPAGCTGAPPGCLTSSLTVPGSAAKSTAIGAIVGGAIGGIASIALLVSTHNFFLDVGSPVEMTLQQSLTLDPEQVADAIRQSAQHPMAEQPIAQRPQPVMRRDNGICYTPGTPGIPGSYIPGTPPIGDSPGTPGTYIPGTPATPPTAYPCP